MEWKELEVLPGANLALHNSASSSPYYAAARETDAATVRTRRQAEKMIFYRGFATFEPALHARLLDDQSIELRNTGDLPISAAIVFENHDGHVGFRVVRDLRDPIRVDAPELNGTPAVEVRAEMQRELQALGLFEKEAIALLAAARDSWFEPGTRVFYFVPPADIDRLLPLTITPAPASVTRALVGRVEILTQPLPAPIRGTIPLRQSTDAFTSCDPTPK
jgi:hypothetical protein